MHIELHYSRLLQAAKRNETHRDTQIFIACKCFRLLYISLCGFVECNDCVPDENHLVCGFVEREHRNRLQIEIYTRNYWGRGHNKRVEIVQYSSPMERVR